MHLFRSNSLLSLSSSLAKETTLFQSPFHTSWIITQNKGMSTWLTQSLSKQFGMFCGEFYLMKTAILKLLQEINKENWQENPFSRNEMTLVLLDVIPELLKEEPQRMQSVIQYMGHNKSSLKVLQLAQIMAGLFDYYLIYRPIELLTWQNETISIEKNAHIQWQILLWQKIVQVLGKEHLAYHIDLFCKKLGQHEYNDTALLNEQKNKNLPQQITVFAITNMPPLFLDFFEQIDKIIPVSLFLLSPSQAYWADIQSKREQFRSFKKLEQKANFEDNMQSLLHYDEGNTLLATYGALGRDFQALLESKIDYHEEDTDLYVIPDEKIVLGFLKKTMLFLQNTVFEIMPEFNIQDESLVIHSCHNRLREVEVVQDIILEQIFEKQVQPNEIAVMVPNIEDYADLIHLVFSISVNQSHFVPYQVSDCSIMSDGAVINLFLKILHSLRSRATFSDLFEIIDNEFIKQKFMLTSEDVDILQYCLQKLSLAWGMDAKQREEFGFENESANSWSYVASRLLLGWSFTTETLWNNVLASPFPFVISFETIQKLLVFIDKWEKLHSFAKQQHTGLVWCNELENIVNVFFEENQETQDNLLVIRKQIETYKQIIKNSNLQALLDLDAIITLFESSWQSTKNETAFLRGGITFCNMIPMRAIPFRVIVLLGMNEGTFPRIEKRLEFDVLSKQKRLGDKVKIEEDRYLFLETLLSAQDKLVITYVGQDASKNTKKQPSLVVNELIEIISKAYTLPKGHTDFYDLLIKQESMFPFYESYFRSPQAKSFNPLYAKAAKSLYEYRKQNHTKQETTEKSFFTLICKQAEEEINLDVSFQSFLSFWSQPYKYFLKEILGIYRKTEEYFDKDNKVKKDLEITEREPLALSYKTKSDVTLRLLETNLLLEENQEAEIAYEYEKARNELSWGKRGYFDFLETKEEADILWQPMQKIIQSGKIENKEVQINLQKITLQGRFINLYKEAKLAYTPHVINGRFLWRNWIEHLLYNIEVEEKKTYLVGYREKATPKQAKVVMFRPVPSDKAKEFLLQYVSLFLKGQEQALCFEPKTLWAYMISIWEGMDKEKAKEVAKREWNKGFQYKDNYDIETYAHIKANSFEELWNSQEYVNLSYYAEELLLPIQDYYIHEIKQIYT